MNAIFVNSWASEISKIIFRGQTTFDPGKFFVCLANTNTFTRTNSIVDFVNAELLAINGYQRAPLLFDNDGSYNNNDQRHEMPVATVSFSSNGGSIQFQTAFLIANGYSVANRPFSSENVNPSEDRIYISNHEFPNANTLVFTPDEGSLLPGGILAGNKYKVVEQENNSFKIADPSNGSIINLTSTGSGSFNARCANGVIGTFAVEPSPVTLLPGQGYTYQIRIGVMNSGFSSGV